MFLFIFCLVGSFQLPDVALITLPFIIHAHFHILVVSLYSLHRVQHGNTLFVVAERCGIIAVFQVIFVFQGINPGKMFCRIDLFRSLFRQSDVLVEFTGIVSKKINFGN